MSKLVSTYNDAIMHIYMQSVKLGTSPMPLTSKNISGLVNIPIHFNVY